MANAIKISIFFRKLPQRCTLSPPPTDLSYNVTPYLPPPSLSSFTDLYSLRGFSQSSKKVAGRAIFNWQYTRSQFQVAPESYANYAGRCPVNMILEQFAHLSTG